MGVGMRGDSHARLHFILVMPKIVGVGSQIARHTSARSWSDVKRAKEVMSCFRLPHRHNSVTKNYRGF